MLNRSRESKIEIPVKICMAAPEVVPTSSVRCYQAHETARMAELQGAELATFSRRAIAFAIDCAIAFVLLLLSIAVVSIVIWAVETRGTFAHYTMHVQFEPELETIVINIMVPILYFGLLTYRWNGQTVGKRIMRIRVVSLVHERMSLWHSIERALGYGAACLEFGFGFLQYFVHPNRRTVQDRIAETIVVREPRK